MYLLQNKERGYVGNSPVFWADPSGYTAYIDDAKEFTEEEADRFVHEDPKKWRKYSIAEVERYAKRVLDMQDYYEIPHVR